MRPSESTVRAVAEAQRLMERALGPDHPVPVEYDDYLKVIAWWHQGGSRSKGEAIRKAFAYLATAHRRARPPLPVVPPPEFHFARPGRRILPTDLTVALVEAMPLGSVERTAAEIMLRTGCRQEEAFRLNVIDVRKEEIRFETRKGPRSERVQVQRVPIMPGLRAVLDAYPASESTRAPYLHLRGRRLEKTSLRKRLVRASRAAGISPPVNGLGWLRNRTTTDAIEGGVDPVVWSRVMGHADTRTTEKHYDGAVMWDRRVAALRALDGARPLPQNSHTLPEKDPAPAGAACDADEGGAQT